MKEPLEPVRPLSSLSGCQSRVLVVHLPRVGVHLEVLVLLDGAESEGAELGVQHVAQPVRAPVDHTQCAVGVIQRVLLPEPRRGACPGRTQPVVLDIGAPTGNSVIPRVTIGARGLCCIEDLALLRCV